MKTIIIDVETTGLPEKKGFNSYYSPSELNRYDGSRIVQLSYAVRDETGEVQFKDSYVIPNGFVIRNEKFHGVSNELATKEGKPLVDLLTVLENDLTNVTTIVGHNINFDINVILSECYRLNLSSVIQAINNCKLYCTMMKGKIAMKLPRYPKLTALYKFYTNEEFNQTHNSLEDVRACLLCYDHLLRDNIQDVPYVEVEVVRCKAIKKNGQQCTYNTNNITGYCGVHKSVHQLVQKKVIVSKYAPRINEANGRMQLYYYVDGKRKSMERRYNDKNYKEKRTELEKIMSAL